MADLRISTVCNSRYECQINFSSLQVNYLQEIFLKKKRWVIITSASPIMCERFYEKVTWAKLILQLTIQPCTPEQILLSELYLRGEMFLLCYRLYVVSNNELGKFYVSFEYYKMFISVLWRHCDLHDRFCDMYWHRCHLDSHHDLHWILHVLLSLLLRSLWRTGGPTGRKKFKTQQNWLWSSLVCDHYHPAVSIHGTQVSIAKLHETHTLVRIPVIWKFHYTEND